MSKPNILFIMADQLSAKALSIYGHRVTKTPAIQGLADCGLVYEAAYCNSPLCGPSRQSMMAGRLPSQIKSYDNASGLGVGTPTFAHYLNAAGYRTCLSGKMHFVGADQKQGFQERLTTDIYPADFSWTPNWDDPNANVRFQDMKNVLNAGMCERSMQIDYDDDVAYQAQRWLYDRATDKSQKPWMLTVSFTSPHDPYTAQPEFWSLYDDSEIDLPTVRVSDISLDTHSMRLQNHYSIHEVDDSTLRRMRHGYYAAISYIDNKVKALIELLDRTGMREDTIIVFTSDHGDMMGERGMYYKKNFFEWSSRVPLILAGPNIKPGRNDRPVSLVDILPTFCQLAEIAPIETCGTSLLENCEKPVLAEYLAEGVSYPTFMIREFNYKLFWSKNDPPLLFDIKNDPNEIENLVEDATHALAFSKLVKLAEEAWNSDKLRSEIINSQNKRRLMQKAEDPQWDYAPDLGMSDRYVRAGRWTVDVESKAHLEVKG